jgi:hypothetical protein
MQQRGKAMNLLSRAWRFCGGASSHPELFVHDPAAAMPYDLDDPFHNAEFQAKVGKLLATARAGEKQPVP